MLAGILAFEWRYQTRQVVFLLATVALSVVAAFLSVTGFGPPGVDVNSPYVVALSLGLLSLFAVFLLTIFCANAALRDAEHGMTEIVYATPVGEPRYLAGRFAGALLAAASVLAVAAVVLMLAPLVLPVDADRVGPVRPAAYLWTLVVLVGPNLLLVGALLFAVATLTRSTLATYVGGIAIYALYLVTALLVDSPLMAGSAPPTREALARAALLDPFGLSAFFEQTRYWTPAERDSRPVALAGRLLLNRLLWLGVSAAVLALVHARFRFRIGEGARKRAAVAAPETARPDVAYAPVAPAAAGDAWPALRSAARIETRHLLGGRTTIALLVLWVFVAGMSAVAELGGGEYGTRALPTLGLLLEALLDPLLLLGTVAVVYYAAEVAWRERAVGFDPLVDATPAASAVLYFAKAAALAALPMLLALVGSLVGLAAQVAHGGRLDLRLVAALLWFAGAPLVLLAMGALAMQALAPNRWVGLVLGLVLVAVARRGQAIGLEHPMLRFAATPPVRHSDMDGFGGAGSSFAAFVMYWALGAAVLACIGWGVRRRGLDDDLRARVLALPRRWGRAGTRAAVACAALFAGTALLLFWTTSAASAWEGSEARAAWRADYERAYRRLAGRAQPSVVAIRTTVDLYPEERRAAVAGTLSLENRSAGVADTLWVVFPRDARRVRVAAPGARLVRHDARFGVHVVALDRPLPPGGSAEMAFALELDRGGLRADEREHDVTGNGTMLTSGDAFPAFGYSAGRELRDPALRREHGLADPPTGTAPLPAGDSARAALHARGPEPPWVTIDATISTSAGQTALGPGRLVRQSASGGRRVFHFVADRPQTSRFAFLSARWAVRRARQGATEVEVWYHPGHEANVDRTLAAAARALEVLGARYGAYPHPVLRIAEVPAWAPFGAFALSGLVLFPEHRGFLADSRAEGIDLVTRRVAHEVAHQWWAHALDPADVAGASTLVETLAKHSEQLVVEAMHGEDALPPILAFDEDRYLAGRAQDPEPEPTLLETTDQAYLYYGKGGIVVHALRDLLGAGAVDRALARLLAEHGGPRGAATTLDLRDALRAEAPGEAERALVDEWLGDRVVYALRVDTAAVAAASTGGFRLTTTITATKAALRDGREVARPADGEAIDVAVYDDRPEVGRVLYAAKHRVAGGRIALSLDLPSRPAYVVVDPYLRRIDRDRTDNRLRTVE